MTFERTPIARAVEDANDDPDRILEELDRHMDDAELLSKRELILGIVEGNINENGTVSQYDIARINEVITDKVNLRGLGSDEQVAGALNAIGENKAGIFRLVIGLLMGIAGISLMVYSFIQQNKDHDKTIQSIRDSTEAIKKNALSFKTVTISASTKPVITEEVIKLYGQIKDLWWQIVGEGATELPVRPEEFLKNTPYPWNQKTKSVSNIVMTQIWRGETGKLRELSKGVEIITRDLAKCTDKVEKWFDDFTGHLTKGEPLPSNFPALEEMLYIKNPFGDKGQILSSLTASVLSRSQQAWPLRYKESELLPTGESALANFKTARDFNLILKGDGTYIADACIHAMDMGSKCADDIKRLGEMSTKMASRLKVMEDKAKDSLSKLQGMERGDYTVGLRKINGQIGDLNKLNEAIDRTVINGIRVAKHVEKFLAQSKHYDDLVSKMRYKAMVAGGEAEAAAGNNSFNLPGLNEFTGDTGGVHQLVPQQKPFQTSETLSQDDMPTAIITHEDERVLDQYVRDIDFELESVDKLQAIADRLHESGTISRSDVAEIEQAAPGLMALLPDQPNFTFRQSTVGYEAGLNAIGNHISAKGGIIAAIIAAIAAVVGFILTKIFGGGNGSGKESAGIPTPAPEVVSSNEQSKANANKIVNDAKARQREEGESKRKDELRQQEQKAARLADEARNAATEERKRQAAVELKALEEKRKAFEAANDKKAREDRIASPSTASDRIGSGSETLKALIFSVDKTDAHLPESVLNIYRQIVIKLLRYGSKDATIANQLCVAWLIGKQPSILSFTSKESINERYNTFVYAPDAVKRVKTACALLDGVGEKIDAISDLAKAAHDSATKFWSTKPETFRSMDDFNKAMSSTGLGDALAKIKERSTELEEEAKKIYPMRSELKYDFIDVTKSDKIMQANPIPVQLEALNAEYDKHTVPRSILNFRDSMKRLETKINEDGRHQDYHGGMRKHNYYMADNVYGSKGMSGDGSGRGVNLELRKKLLEDGMPSEVFAAIARVQREQIDYVNQAHRKIQGAVNSSAYVLGDLRRFYEVAVHAGKENVEYQNQLKKLIDEFKK